MTVKIRSAIASDAEACGHIIYNAFRELAEAHGFPPDFRSWDESTQLVSMMIAHRGMFGAVAELERRVVGSNFLLEDDPIRAVGPITVEPTFQGQGIGRRL